MSCIIWDNGVFKDDSTIKGENLVELLRDRLEWENEDMIQAYLSGSMVDFMEDP